MAKACTHGAWVLRAVVRGGWLRAGCRRPVLERVLQAVLRRGAGCFAACPARSRRPLPSTLPPGQAASARCWSWETAATPPSPGAASAPGWPGAGGCWGGGEPRAGSGRRAALDAAPCPGGSSRGSSLAQPERLLRVLAARPPARSAYLTRLGTWKHRAYVAGNWTLTLLFGRDISRW